jgi:hypothetical protein
LIEEAPIHLSVEKVAVREVLMEVEFISLIVGDHRGILDQQLRPHPSHLPNLIIVTLISCIIIK